MQGSPVLAAGGGLAALEAAIIGVVPEGPVRSLVQVGLPLLVGTIAHWWTRNGSVMWRDFERLIRQVHELNERMVIVEASQAQNQASIDAETAKVQAVEAKLVTVQQEIDALKAQPNAQALDFSGLDAALAAESAQADTDVADAAPPEPPAQ